MKYHVYQEMFLICFQLPCRSRILNKDCGCCCGVVGATVPGCGSVGFRGMRMSELLVSVTTCRGLQVDTLDRLPTTILKQDHFDLSLVVAFPGAVSTVQSCSAPWVSCGHFRVKPQLHRDFQSLTLLKIETAAPPIMLWGM